MVAEGIVMDLDGASPPLSEASSGWPGTRAGFDALVEQYQNPLVRYAFRRLGQFQDAEDAVQDVLVRAYAQVTRGRRVSSAIAYLYRMTGNACTDVLRRRRRARLLAVQAEANPTTDGGRSGAYEASRIEDLQRIERLLARLPRRQAEVVRLRVWDGLRFEQIAEVLGCPAATVKSRFRYALLKLRENIVKQKEDRS